MAKELIALVRDHDLHLGDTLKMMYLERSKLEASIAEVSRQRMRYAVVMRAAEELERDFTIIPKGDKDAPTNDGE